MVDITYMKPTDHPNMRMVMPCWNEGYVAIFENGLATRIRCKDHYDGMIYRQEDTSGYERLTEEKIFGKQ